MFLPIRETAYRTAYRRSARIIPFLVALLSLAWLIVFNIPVYSGQKGDMEGIVTTAEGTPLLGAVVSVIHRFLPGTKIFAVSDRQGRFYFDGLRPGEYLLQANAGGFIPLTVKGVRIFSGQSLATELNMHRLDPADGQKEMIVDSMDDLKWYLRSATRDVLNREEGLLPEFEKEAPSRRSTNLLDINGRVEMAASATSGEAGPNPFNQIQSSTMVDLAGGLSETTAWDMSARLFDHAALAYRAQGRVHCDLIENHSIQMGAEYFSYPGTRNVLLNSPAVESTDWWSGSVYAEDTWNIFNPLALGCGVRFNHYDYLDESDYLSPRVIVWYSPAENTSISGSVAYEAAAMGGDALFVYGPVHPGAAQDSLEAERRLRYAVTLEQRFKGDSRVQVTAFYQETDDKIANYYTGQDLGLHSRTQGFQMFNLGDTQTRGVKVEISKRLHPMIRSSIGYQIRKANFNGENTTTLRGTPADDTILLLDHIMQDISATAEADIAFTATTVAAILRFNTGYPMIDSRAGHLPFTRTIDVRFRQRLPVLRLPASELQAILEIANLLNTTFPQVITLNGDQFVGLPRRITGGISLVF